MAEMRSRPNLRNESVDADDGRELALQDLDCDLAIVPDVVGEIHGCHTPDAKLSLEPVSWQQRVGKLCGDARHPVILANSAMDAVRGGGPQPGTWNPDPGAPHGA
jgi:hypothetical protein